MFDKIHHLLTRLARALSEFGAMLVRPLERAAEAIAHTFFAAWESTEGLFANAFYWLTWPFRAVGRLIAAVGRGILPEAIREKLASMGSWLSALPTRMVAAVLHASEALNLDRPLLGLVWLLQPLWRPIAAVGGFAYAWFTTREWRQLKWALPALVMLLPFAAVWAHSFWNGNGAVVSRYKDSMKEALETQDYESAQLYEQKLAQLGVDTQLTEYRTALALAEEDKLDEAYKRMQLLAPEEQTGYPSAHFWIAQRLVSGQLIDDKKESQRLAKVHLDHLESLNMTGSYQQFLRAILSVQDGQLEEAALLLKPLVAILPGAAFERMRINLALKRPEQAREDARALVTHVAGQERRGTVLLPGELQWWLAAEEVLGNLQKMRTILEKWRALEPENQQAKQALARVIRRQAAQLLKDPLPDQQQIVDLWLTAAELENNAGSLLQMARAIYKDRNKSPIYGRLLEALRESPRTPAQLLLAVGTEAAVAEQYQEARQFFEIAVQRDPTNPAAWNNYGLVLGEGADARLEEALVAVNRALEIAPQEYRFRETRGQILLRLKRWQEAIEDLEFALNGMPQLGAIHESLALAYTALGEDELANLHRTLVE
ncbi:tetratricopeptide repeat protein [Adhaeretor mobilis]|uniref:Tetratricopeptide repeat protein n=1 Tax=Adhaeretor mobilis TaxID=1930276 RepID=A0A517MQ11_9BACT|nr:hypothetical protein [Adhaeretor mobilis]QDS96970.1 Tetratricopeptide repeat protein [Adhaeretor mobilis]